ncbi:MAG: isoprenyl transferase [Deltaproteobacteria bacterium]|nr:isoprenyl transferase [Deltaproteobacteria bacterium]
MPNIDPEKLPKHVAIIMDGNGRWARQRAMNRVRGHEVGAESVRVIVRTSRELGIRWLTLYAFSEENWVRPKYEIRALMGLLKRFLKSELQEMLENGIRLNTIGRIGKLPADVQETLRETKELTSGNSDMVLTLALSYGSRQEIFDAFQKLAARIEAGELSAKAITEGMISDALYTAGMPDPDLLIRTSGEFRLSNFLLWQMAYTEIYITPTYWPDFRREEYLKALEEFQKRERRFGATGDQVAEGGKPISPRDAGHVTQ